MKIKNVVNIIVLITLKIILIYLAYIFLTVQIRFQEETMWYYFVMVSKDLIILSIHMLIVTLILFIKSVLQKSEKGLIFILSLFSTGFIYLFHFFGLK